MCSDGALSGSGDCGSAGDVYHLLDVPVCKKLPASVDGVETSSVYRIYLSAHR